LAFEKVSCCDGGRRSPPAPERHRLKTGFRRKLCHFKAGFRIGRLNDDLILGGQQSTPATSVFALFLGIAQEPMGKSGDIWLRG